MFHCCSACYSRWFLFINVYSWMINTFNVHPHCLEWCRASLFSSWLSNSLLCVDTTFSCPFISWWSQVVSMLWIILCESWCVDIFDILFSFSLDVVKLLDHKVAGLFYLFGEPMDLLKHLLSHGPTHSFLTPWHHRWADCHWLTDWQEVRGWAWDLRTLLEAPEVLPSHPP